MPHSKIEWEKEFDCFWHEEQFADALNEFAHTEGYENALNFAPEQYQKLKSFIQNLIPLIREETIREVLPEKRRIYALEDAVYYSCRQEILSRAKQLWGLTIKE